jgi:hypothetical protein
MDTAVHEGSKQAMPMATKTLKDEDIKVLFKPGGASAAAAPHELFGSGFTFRIDWGNKHGHWNLRLNSSAITKDSRVFCSASEFGGGDQADFIGAARYTVHNVAPQDGHVDIWLEVEWGADIRVHVDYLVVNP